MTKKGFTVWFTGLPCSGKTSLAEALEAELKSRGEAVERLDGDVVRQGLSKDLGFSKEDRRKNLERVTYVAQLLSRNGVAAIVAFVSPYRSMRDAARGAIERFAEVYVRCPLEVCEKRDVKGMYKKARSGEIADFTGVSDPYEPPSSAEITVDTDREDVAACVSRVVAHLESLGWIYPSNPWPKSELLQKAYALASKHHSGQFRKGGLPYLTHPVAVAKMLSRAGLPERVLAAALLHDVLEDSGCDLEEMQKAVGPDVTRLVTEVTDRDKTVGWEERKQAYLRLMESASTEGLAIACADKAHNVADLADGLARGGAAFTGQFYARLDEKADNYRRIHDVIARRYPACPVLPQLRAALEALDGARAKAARA